MGEQRGNDSREEFRPCPEDTLFREYSLFVEDTAPFSDRRQTFSNIMVAVNTLLVAGIVALLRDSNPHILWRSIITVLLLGAGLAVCVIWRKLFIEYKDTIELRTGFLKEIERRAGKSEKDGMYPMLDKKFYHRQDRKRGFTRLEKFLPWVFIILYLIFVLLVVFGMGLYLGGMLLQPGHFLPHIW